MTREDRIYSASIKSLHPLLMWVHGLIQKMPFSMKERHEIDLCIEEIFVNIVKHGLKAEDKEVFITVGVEEGAVEITFKDEGKPFNPVEVPKKRLEIGKDQGVGILLVKELCDKMEYKRDNGVNELTIRKENQNRTKS